MSKKPQKKKDFSLGGVVWDPDKEKLLLIHVENLVYQKVWTFPKGHPEQGESHEQAALREVREETGWDCKIQKQMIDVHYTYERGHVTYEKTVRWYLMKPLKKVGEFQQDEVLDAQWMDLALAEKKISYTSDRTLLKQLKANL